MKESIQNKLNNLIDRHEELAGLMSEPDVITNQNKFRDFSKEYAQLEPVVNCFKKYNSARFDLKSADEMLKDDDPDVREMAAEEKNTAAETIETLELAHEGIRVETT